MKTLFERLQSEGAAAVAELVGARQQENVQLEFKAKANAAHGELTRDDRKVLGPELSAMANSMGGLIVYGIVARKDVDGIDAASAVAPITGLSRFLSEVTRAVGDLLSPTHEGIHVEAVRDGSSTDAGYLAIFVERSERRPHMSQAAQDGRYYKRAGDQAIRMEHFEVEDAFKRFSTAKLDVRVSDVSQADQMNEITRIRFVMGLLNESHVTALYPYLAIGNLRGWELESGGPLAGSGFVNGWYSFHGGANTVVNPGVMIDTIILRVNMTHGQHYGRPAHESYVAFDYRIGCKDTPLRKGRLEIVGRAFEELISPLLPPLQSR